jgi:Mor family transcriptional regulator
MEELDKEVANLYNSGLNIREIAKIKNLSYETIRKILKSKKVKWRRNYVSDFTDEQVKDIIKRFDNGELIKKIAKWYEISAPAISRLLIANNRNPISSNRKYDILRQTPINNIQKQILVGTLLGDGCLYRDSKKSNFKLSFSHCKKQEQYFHWKIAMFDPFINTFRQNIDKRGNSIMLQTATICHKDLNIFANMFYDESRIKHVPDNLDIYMTPLALAVWIMDDGNLKCNVNYRIFSMSFTEEENYKLRDLLKRCFNINSKVMCYTRNNKKYWLININKENSQKLSDIIRPYVVECMKYKLMPGPSTTECQTPDKGDDIV